MRITLCGSTRFKDLFLEANKRLTAGGHVVYSVAFHSHAENIEPSPDLKETLDLVHLCKISNSQMVVVVTDDTGYYGDSTRRELKWARMNGQSILFYNNPAQMAVLFDGEESGWDPKLRFFKDPEVLRG